MIPGNNQLLLCPAAMAEAVQEYLDKRTTAQIAKVTEVKFDNGHFVVRLGDSSD